MNNRITYQELCNQLSNQYCHDYSNPELEELVKTADWAEIKKALTPAMRKACKSYFRYIADRSFGCLPQEISAWESVVNTAYLARKKIAKAKKYKPKG